MVFSFDDHIIYGGKVQNADNYLIQRPPYGDYKAHIRKMIDNHDTISKEDLYDAFLDMTERYLTEMVSALSYEKVLIKEYGEDEGNQIIEQVVTSNLALRDLDETNGADIDPRERIENLLSYIECEFSRGLN